MKKAKKAKQPTSCKPKGRRKKTVLDQSSIPAINPQHHPDAAGIDVGAEEFVAALPPGRSEQTVRTFATYTSGVEALRDWLLEHSIKTAALESTGNYWIMLYDKLTEAGIEVYLVNARHVKGVPGKKTDVCDAQWLQQLHAAGLLRKSFRPALEIVPLRYLMRHRSEMVEHAATQLHLMQKVLTEMNLKLHHVFSDIDGVSAQAIIGAILAGERDAHALAKLRDRRCKSPLTDILEALKGDYRPEYLFVLRQAWEAWQQTQKAIVACDVQLSALATKVESQMQAPLPAAENKQQHKLAKNSPDMGIYQTGWRFYGVDLSDIPGVSAGVISALVSEVGTRQQMLSAFRSAGAFASWLGLCPDNRVSGGKVLKARTRKVPSRLARAMRLAAFGLQRNDSEMGQMLRRFKGRLGKAEGITATAHKLARVIYGVIKSQCRYEEQEAFKVSPQKLQRRHRRLQEEAAKLGFALTQITSAS
ncbi:MAG: IS110 family transposase [Verrucomicrobia bacterium]|nr:IS110 family transposase [Verrucomicrobiota bacterium]